jgi:phage shock protein E
MKVVAILAVLFVFFLIIAKSAGGKRISGQEARAKVADGALLLDVRTPAEFGAGHIDGARNIPVQSLKGRFKEVGGKDQTIVVYCRSGARSGQAMSLLKAAGYGDVHNLGPQTAW